MPPIKQLPWGKITLLAAFAALFVYMVGNMMSVGGRIG